MKTLLSYNGSNQKPMVDHQSLNSQFKRKKEEARIG